MSDKLRCLFHGRDCKDDTEDRVACTVCDGVITLEEEYGPLAAWTYEQFTVLTRMHANMMVELEARTDWILKRMKHRGYLKRADEYGAVIEYNGACHCHPEPKEFIIPSNWLFADDWEAKVDEYMRQLEAKRLAAEAEIDKIRQAQERKDFERLRRKFETTEK